MRRHPLDLTSLLAGLVFLSLAATYLFAAAAGHRVDATWVLPVALVALGAAGLAGGIVRATRRTDPATASGDSEVAEPQPSADAAEG